VIGDNAALARTQGGGSATVMPEYTVSPLDGLRAALPDAEVSYSRGAVVQQGVTELPLAQMTNPVTGGPGLRVRFLAADGSELFTEDRRSSALVWFGGDAPIGRSASVQLVTRFTPPESGPVRIGFAAVGHGRVYLDGELIVDEHVRSELADLGASVLAPPTAAAEVRLTAGTPVELRFEYELSGRTGPLAGLPGRQDDRVRAVAAANPRTVVLVNAGAPVLLPWRDQVAAVLVGYFGGQEFGHAVADVLLGAAEPGGRLPTTWPAAEADVPVLSTTPAGGKPPGALAGRLRAGARARPGDRAGPAQRADPAAGLLGRRLAV
jgi:beta-glucosidase